MTQLNDLFTKEFDSESNDEEYVPTQKEVEKSNEEVFGKHQNKEVEVNKTKVDAIWEKLKSKKTSAPQKNAPPVNSTKEPEKDEKEKEKELDEQIKAALKKSKEQKAKTITDTYYFAGQKFETKKEVDEKELEKMKKKQTHKGLDSLIDSISKKKNISTIDKSKRDWKNYVEEKKIEKELMNNRKDGFLGKKQFLDNSNAYVHEQNQISIKKAKYAYETKVNSK